jgi:predicted RNA-binding Zn ribbon-like protein
MNTIQVTTDNGVINYTESEVLRFIEKAGETDAVQQVANETRARVSSIRNTVRDFFSEREWESRETTVTLDEVNELLNSIGSHSIQTTYSGSITISVSFSDLDADDEDDAISKIQDEITVDLYNASIQIDDVSVDEITEE